MPCYSRQSAKGTLVTAIATFVVAYATTLPRPPCQLPVFSLRCLNMKNYSQEIQTSCGNVTAGTDQLYTAFGRDSWSVPLSHSRFCAPMIKISTKTTFTFAETRYIIRIAAVKGNPNINENCFRFRKQFFPPFFSFKFSVFIIR